MTKHKYVGLDVHQATTSITVLDPNGKLLSQSTIQTSAPQIRDFICGLSGTVFEEGTHTAWLYDLIKPLVAELIVCDPRQDHPSTFKPSSRHHIPFASEAALSAPRFDAFPLIHFNSISQMLPVVSAYS